MTKEQYVEIKLHGTGEDNTDALADKVEISVNNLTTAQLAVVALQLLDDVNKKFKEDGDCTLVQYIGRVIYENQQRRKAVKDVDKALAEVLAKKQKEFDVGENIKNENDLVNYMRAAMEEIPENFTKKDFEYLLIACKDVLKIAEEKGWK